MWLKIRTWCRDSEVIAFGYVQIVFGSLWLALSTADLAPLITDPRALTVWMIFNGFVTNYLRGRRATFTEADDKGPPKEAQ